MPDSQEPIETGPPSLTILPTVYPTSPPLEEVIGQFWNLGPDFASVELLIPEELRGQALTLDFTLIDADDFVQPSVQIDNLIFVPEPGSFLLVAGGLMLLSIPGFGPGRRHRGSPNATG